MILTSWEKAELTLRLWGTRVPLCFESSMPLSGHPCSDSFSFERGHPLLVETEEMNFEKDPKLRIQVELGGMESRLHLEEFAISLWRTQSA